MMTDKQRAKMWKKRYGILQSQLEKEREFIPYQKCPKCDGQGIVSKPSHIAGDQMQWDSASTNHQCDVCNGSKIIQMMITSNPK